MSEACSVGSEFSSHTVYAHPADLRLQQQQRSQRAGHLGSKRSLDVSDATGDELTPSKRNACYRSDDLSCLEATLFDRCPASGGKQAPEVESRLLRGQAPETCSADLEAMLRLAFRAENGSLPDPCYMERHGPTAQAAHFIEPAMRAVAVSWLVEVAAEFHLQQETLFLAVSLLDCFLSHATAVPRSQLQLTAVSCMMVAAKHEENGRVPSALEFTHIADGCFQKEALLRMESLVLQTLRFRVMKPTAFSLHCLLAELLRPTPREATLALYLMELAMLEYRMLRFRPSMIAAASLLLAQVERLGFEGAERVAQAAAYPTAALQECCAELCELQAAAFDVNDHFNPLMAVKEKFRDVRWHCVAMEAPLDAAAVWGLLAGRV